MGHENMEAQGEYVAWIAELFPRQGEWTEAHYYALPETNRKVELANGVLTMSPSPSDKHQHVVVKLVVALDTYVTTHRLGVVRVAPYDVRLFPGTIRQPDVLFIREEHRARISRTLEGPPDWVAEVISPEDRETDEVVKLAEYARAGIPEYWLLDSEQGTIRVYVLTGETYTLTATHGAGQIARSATITGFEIAVNAVFGG